MNNDMSMRYVLPTLLCILAGCAQPLFSDDAPTSSAGSTGTPLTYRCESGATIQVHYPSNSTATVTYAEQTLAMTIAVSASGARYVGEQLEWWTKGAGVGSKGTLFRHEPDGTTGEAVERCVQH